MTLTTHKRDFPGTRDSIRDARKWAAEIVQGITPAVPLDLCSDVVLVVSELATNAVRHTRSGFPDGLYTVTIDADYWRILVRVTDEGSASVPKARTPDHFAESGRGLAMVAALADDAGPLPADQGPGYMAMFYLCTWGTR